MKRAEWEHYFRSSKTNQLLINPWSLICHQMAKWHRPTSRTGPKTYERPQTSEFGKWWNQRSVPGHSRHSAVSAPDLIYHRCVTVHLDAHHSLPWATCPLPSASPDCHIKPHTCSHSPHLLQLPGHIINPQVVFCRLTRPQKNPEILCWFKGNVTHPCDTHHSVIFNAGSGDVATPHETWTQDRA